MPVDRPTGYEEFMFFNVDRLLDYIRCNLPRTAPRHAEIVKDLYAIEVKIAEDARTLHVRRP